MACARCEHKGYIETYVHISAGFRPAVKPCHHCNDVKAYSKRVQEMLNGKVVAEPMPPMPPTTPKKPTKPRFRVIDGGG